MNKILLPVFSLVILGFQSGCKKDDNPDPPDPQPEYVLLAQQTIGPEGGALEVANTFSLRVPPGAFTAASVIQLYSSDEVNPYEENGASGVYYLKGVPGTFSKDLTLSLKHNDLGQGESFLAMGQLSYTSGAGYRFIWTFGDGSGEVTLDGTNTVTHQWDAIGVYPVHTEIRLLSDNSLVGEASEIAVIEGQTNYLPLLHSIKHIAVSLPSNGHHYFNDGSVCGDYLTAQSTYLDAMGLL